MWPDQYVVKMDMSGGDVVARSWRKELGGSDEQADLFCNRFGGVDHTFLSLRFGYRSLDLQRIE